MSKFFKVIIGIVIFPPLISLLVYMVFPKLLGMNTFMQENETLGIILMWSIIVIPVLGLAYFANKKKQ